MSTDGGGAAVDALVAAAADALDNHLHETATFLAERALAHNPLSQSLKLVLAKCYVAQNQHNRAAHLLKNDSAPQNRYLLAVCHAHMGRLNDAMIALIGHKHDDDDEAIAEVPNGAAGLCLLGTICMRTQPQQSQTQRARAARYFRRALEINPLMWSAYESLSHLNQPLPDLPTDLSHLVAATSSAALTSNPPSSVTPVYGGVSRMFFRTSDINTPAGAADEIPPNSGTGSLPSTGNAGHAALQTTPAMITPQAIGGSSAPPAGPLPKRRHAPGSIDEIPPAPSCGSNLVTPASAISGRRGRGTVHTPNNPPTRRSSRLQAGSVASEMPPPTPLHARDSVSDSPNTNAEGACRAAALVHQIAGAYRLLCNFECKEALEAFKLLPPNQFESGWVLTQVGRTQFELMRYKDALATFAHIHRTEPHRLRGMEIHSTILWHLKRDVDLSYLAKIALESDRHSPYTCCVLGNCFSLQKEHDTALRFFQRAIQVAPDFAYAHTLCGHEYAAKDDFDKAMGAYRTALRIDDRHYNAWYGLGSIFYRQEKFEHAEYHLSKALAINPRSSALYCYLGMSLHANRKSQQALKLLSSAIAIDNKNPLARFQKAQILLSIDRLEEALEELTMLVSVAPKEGSVYFQLGKVYKRLGRTREAMTAFTTALDLSPRDAQQIKMCLINLEQEDDGQVDDHI